MKDVVENKPKKEFPKFRKDGKPVGKGGRPRKREVNTISREQRIPLTGFRDKLSVFGKDPNYYYYWTADTSEGGMEIQRYKAAGFDFVQSNEVTIGDVYVYKTENVGTIVRAPSGDGRYLFLMKQPMEWHLEDQRNYYADIDDKEDALRDPNQQGVDGAYGKALYRERD